MGIAVTGNVTTKKLCIDRSYSTRKKEWDERYWVSVAVQPTIVNSGSHKVRVQGYEISKDCAAAKSLEFAKQRRYIFQWNTDTMYPVGYEPPQLLQHQIGLRGKVLRPGEQYVLPKKAATCTAPLSFEPVFDMLSVGTYFLTFDTTLQIDGLTRKDFPVVAADPIPVTIPAEARTLAGRLKGRLDQSSSRAQYVCEEITE